MKNNNKLWGRLCLFLLVGLTAALAPSKPARASKFADFTVVDDASYADIFHDDGSILTGRMTIEGSYHRLIGHVIHEVNGTFVWIPFTLLWNPREHIPVEGSFRRLGRDRKWRDATSLQQTLHGVRPALVPPDDASGKTLNISRDSNTAVGFYDNGFSTPYHAFYVNGDDNDVIDIGTIDPANNATRSSFATDVSSDGSIIVGHSDDLTGLTWHAFLWNATDGMLDLGSGNGANGYSRATGVNGAGTLIVGESDFPGGFGSIKQAFRWTQNGGFVSLGSIEPDWPSMATAVTEDGSVIVGKSGVSFNDGGVQTNRDRAFRWTSADGMEDLGVLGTDESSVAVAVSDDGNIVVGHSIATGLAVEEVGGKFAGGDGNRVFYWTPAGGMKDFQQLLADAGADQTGITIVSVGAISPNGQWIVGQALTPNSDQGQTYPYIVHYCGDEIPEGECDDTGTSPPDFSIGVSQTEATVAAGDSATTTLTFNSSGGLTGDVTFSCSGLPTGAACSFSPETITLSSVAQSTELEITTDGSDPAASVASSRTPGVPAPLAPIFAVAGILAMRTGSRRKRLTTFLRTSSVGLLAVVMLGALVACGGGDSGGNEPPPPAATGTPAGTYTVTVTATSGAGADAISHDIPLSLTVTR